MYLDIDHSLLDIELYTYFGVLDSRRTLLHKLLNNNILQS